MLTKTESIQLDINTDWCKGCEICIYTCPNHLLQLSKNLNVSGFHYAELLHPEKCTGCGLCAQMCPDIVIQIWIQSL